MSKSSTTTKPAAYQLVLPARILRREITLRGIAPRDFAIALGVSAHKAGALLSGRSPISPEIAVRLSAYFGNTAQFWLNLQSAYDLARFELKSGVSVRRRIACAGEAPLKQVA